MPWIPYSTPSFMRRSKILKPDYTIKAQNIIMNYSVMK